MLKQQLPRSVSLNNGCWYNFKERNPSLPLKSGDIRIGEKLNSADVRQVTNLAL